MANRRTNRIFKLMVLLSLLLSGIVASITMAFTNGFNTTVFLVTFFVTLVICAILFIIFSLPKVKGNLGEKKVSKYLNLLANKYGGTVIDDVIIPDENSNRTSQIDHIYVSNYGVFVIETKNYAGRIYGSKDQQQWTQVLAYGNTKNRLYNPVKQNSTHIYRLKKALNINTTYISVVIFVKANISHVDCDGVYVLRDITKIINGNSKRIISDKDMEIIVNKLKYFKENPVKTSEEHVKEIKMMKKAINNNICPRCGGDLILRESKDGKLFYGCSNYPRCKFTKRED